MTRKFIWIIAVIALVLFVSAIVVNQGIAPKDTNGKKLFFKVKKGESLSQALTRAEKIGIIKSAKIASFYSTLRRDRSQMTVGTYELSASMSAPEIIDVLLSQKPIQQRVLIREGLWAEKIAEILESKNVTTQTEFLTLVESPISPPNFIPENQSLEGYLFPDTYDLPPLLGAEISINKMLEAFNQKVYIPLGKPDPATLRKWVIIGSMVELEAAVDSDRSKVASVIYNRLAKNMPLQIDATINFAKKDWRPLARSEYKYDHPYNTYRILGLPPGPICSPGIASIKAAANPAKTNYLYYVALPDRSHLFAENFEQHKKNIIASRRAFAAISK